MRFLKRLRMTPALWVTLAVTAALGGNAATVERGQWIDLFDGETLFGWTAFGTGDWHVRDGAVVCTSGEGTWLATNARFRDFELTARMRVLQGVAGLIVRNDLQGHPIGNGAAVVVLPASEGGETPWQDVRLAAHGGIIEASIDGEPVRGLSARPGRGHVGILHFRGAVVEVRELRLRPLGLTPLFNGENLDGWTVLEGERLTSEFKVVDGALNITHGPGQIETEGLHRDFLFQTEILSNGDHLNSGVFFRGPQGVFWRGYESQVRNEWEGDDRTRPVDYGTGGLYAIQPARHVVSSDREWFSKTIVCDGNYMGVWVDGIQVADYFDMRPVNEAGDAKAGFVPAPGTIHLQGHDPGTDLSFRGINIQEYR